MVTTLQERARELAAEVDEERAADAARRIEERRPMVEQLVSDLVGEWLEAARLEIAWHPGPLTAQGESGDHWHAHVAFENPDDDDELELVLFVDLAQVRLRRIDNDPEPTSAGHTQGWEERPGYGHWLLPRTCENCGDAYAEHAGWSLADLGRALDRPPRHRCAQERVVVESHLIVGEGRIETDAKQRMVELEEEGRIVSTHVDSGRLILVGYLPSDADLF